MGMTVAIAVGGQGEAGAVDQPGEFFEVFALEPW